MEVAANHMESVHVLRHSFRPSEHLAVALENYTEPGATHPRSLLYATRLITLNTERHPHHEIAIDFEMVNRAFVKRHREKVFFGREMPEIPGEKTRTRVTSRLIGKEVLRVGFLPNNEALFTELLAGFDALPNDTENPSGQRVRYYLHADMQAKGGFDASRIADNTASVAAELDVIERGRLFFATPLGIDWRVIPLPNTLPASTTRE